MAFPASWAGKCGCCGDAFSEGADVAFSDEVGLVIADHLNRYTAKRAEVCPKCFATKAANGACLCED